jgi:putative hydrolase of the HAD superfamily
MNGILNLIFDADDTLWENNIYYENTREELLRLCVKYGINEMEAERKFKNTETRIVHEKGYGTVNFLNILEHVFNKLLPIAARNEFDRILITFKSAISQPRQLFSGVQDTLEYLSEKYSLFLLTKGDIEEQKDKIYHSGLQKFFSASFVESEKNVDTYQRIINRQGWQVSQTCMIGNSPKSDINPALNLGMHAIYIHYPSTWYLDDEPLLTDNERLITIKSFSGLRDIF